MSGHVYYRFKAAKEPSRVTFDGVGISVFDLKREILLALKVGRSADVDLAIYNADTEEEFKNDHTVIPRSSTVIARRLPPRKPGHGNAQYYLAEANNGSARVSAPAAAHADWRGGGAITKDFRAKEVKSEAPLTLTGNAEADEEAAGLRAMLAAQEEQWNQTQEVMATATRVGRNPGNFRDSRPPRPPQNGGGGGGSGDRPRREPHQVPTTAPPQGYICYRCGQKGHWIQECPTNDNPEFEGRPRIKRTTGIPKSFLQKVEGKPGDGQNVMVTADGSFVIAKPDDASWKQHKSIVVKNLSAADIQNLQPSDPDLACSICTKLLKDAVRTPCCQTAFCDSCIRAHLKEHNSVCPECESKVPAGVGGLVEDTDRRVRSQDYVDDLVRASKEAVEDKEGEDEAGEAVSSQEEEKAGSPSLKTGSALPETAEKDIEEKGHDASTQSDASASQTSTSETKMADLAPAATTSSPSLEPNASQSTLFSDQSGEGQNQHQNSMNGQMNHPNPAMMNGGMGMMNPGMGMVNPGMGMVNNGMMAMGPGMGMGGNGFIPLPALHLQLNQLQMAFQNPQLHPQMRMQMMMRQQQLQHQLAMQMQMQMAGGGMQFHQQQHQQAFPQQQMGMGGGAGGHQMQHQNGRGGGMGGRGGGGGGGGGGMGRGGNRFDLSSFQQQLQQQHRPGGVVNPSMPGGGMGNGRKQNGKRDRSEDMVELTTGEKVPRYM